MRKKSPEQRQAKLVRGEPETAMRIGIRSLILSVLVSVCTWVAITVINYESPMMVSASQHQFEDSNAAYAKAHALATADPSSLVYFISGCMYILVWGVAGWQFWRLAQERE